MNFWFWSLTFGSVLTRHEKEIATCLRGQNRLETYWFVAFFVITNSFRIQRTKTILKKMLR